MITYQFTGVTGIPQIFKSEETNRTKHCSKTDYLEVPLTIFVPHIHAAEVGIDYMQTKITAALDKMVAELNTPTKGETV